MGMFYTMHFSPAANLATFISMRILTVAGLPFLFVPISTMAFSDVPRELNNKASALYALFRNLGGSFGIALIATYLFRHQQIWQTYLSGGVTPYNIQTQQSLAQHAAALVSAGVSQAAAPAQAQAQLYSQLQQQAGFMAYVDSFQAMSWIMLLLIPVALLMPSVKPKKDAAPVEAH
jgi:DHA2 family multidrug resistance protein